jgi:hypothetical protein
MTVKFKVSFHSDKQFFIINRTDDGGEIILDRTFTHWDEEVEVYDFIVDGDYANYFEGCLNNSDAVIEYERGDDEQA